MNRNKIHNNLHFARRAPIGSGFGVTISGKRGKGNNDRKKGKGKGENQRPVSKGKGNNPGSSGSSSDHDSPADIGESLAWLGNLSQEDTSKFPCKILNVNSKCKSGDDCDFVHRTLTEAKVNKMASRRHPPTTLQG